MMTLIDYLGMAAIWLFVALVGSIGIAGWHAWQLLVYSHLPY